MPNKATASKESGSVRRIDTAINDVANELDAGMDQLVGEIMDTIRRELPALDEPLWAQLGAPMRRSAFALTRGCLAALQRRRYDPIDSPSEALEEARAAARAGLRLPDLLTMYRLGHQILDRCMELATNGVPRCAASRRDTAYRLEVYVQLRRRGGKGSGRRI